MGGGGREATAVVPTSASTWELADDSYLMLFLHGGLYTDSDTAPLQHALTWGHDPLDVTGPSVDALRALLAAGFDGLTSQGEEEGYAFTNTQHPILDASVSAVLSVENNVIGHGDRWRVDVGDTDPGWEDQFESAVQICQWTMMVSGAMQMRGDNLCILCTEPGLMSRANLSTPSSSTHYPVSCPACWSCKKSMAANWTGTQAH